MGDNQGDGQSQSQPRSFQALKEHTMAHKIDMALWTTRVLAIFFTLAYFIPIFG